MDKTERLLRMMEHPDRYTDAQWQELLSDEVCRELYEAMRLSVSAFEAEDAKEKIADGIKEKEWQRFKENSSFLILNSSFQKIAAAFIGLLMLSGIAYAAIHIAHQYQQTETSTPNDTTAVANSSFFTHRSSLPKDSIAQMRIFENTPLDEMVSEIATYYNKVADIQNEQAHELRLYYKWEPQQALESIVEDLNHFDRVNLALEGDRLIVKP